MQFKGQALSDQGPLKANKTSEMKGGWKTTLINLNWQTPQLEPNSLSACKCKFLNYMSSHCGCAMIFLYQQTKCGTR